MANDSTRTGANAGLQYLAGIHSAVKDAARRMSGYCPAAAQGADSAVIVGECPFSGVVKSVEYIPNAALVGAVTNNRTFSLYNRTGAGAGTTLVASLNMTNGVNLTAKDKKTITLSVTGADLVVTAGDVLEFLSTHIGTGIADSGGLVIVMIDLS